MNERWGLLVVDDEPRARGVIRKMLGGAKEFQVVGECGNGYEAVDAVRSLHPDLMLLDVQMPEVDGFMALERLRGDVLPQIVFITAYDQYALKAFEVNALDYLLKPFDEGRFLEMLRRARSQLIQRNLSGQNQRIMSLLEGMKRPPAYLERFAVRLKGRIILLPVDEVEWIEAEEKYVRLHTKSASYLIRDTLARLDGCLNPNQFTRVHRSAIVKIGGVLEIQSDFHGDYHLILKTGERLPLGRTYRDRFFESIEMNR